MLYLKNTLGGLSRSLTDSALSSFQGPHRWWKLALFAVLFVLPGGSVGVAVFAWFEHRRVQKDARRVAAAESVGSVGLPAASGGVIAVAKAVPVLAGSAAATCHARGDAPCRAAAGKLARQTTSSDSRV
ncbi:hypothetical protein [Paraburkholderia fungorum]|uniref:Multidrug ABC transporter ATPase n=1 Tax=Paraburkholderia fungorum TaxID=134537 RepID=A0A420G0C6_9BURK|nr:hypothetical protein [Paraburkholderia fungorum]RKF38646.1 hypothetical protein BCY88_34420 [Paraburkholderia fungorum]